QVATAQIFQYQIMKSSAAEIDCGPVTEAADDIRMTHAIESHGFILKVLNQGGLELRVLITLKQHVECFDHDCAKSLVGRSGVARQIDFRDQGEWVLTKRTTHDNGKLERIASAAVIYCKHQRSAVQVEKLRLFGITRFFD